MIFGGYSLEVLVDNQPLSEYWEDDIPERVIPTGPSYVYNHITKQKLSCNRHCYAAVKHPSTDFTIRYTCPLANPQTIICAMLYIDGKSDNVWIPLDHSRAYTQDSFYSEGRDKRHMFRFGVTLWSGDGDPGAEIIPFANRASAYGTPGCISVVFYWASRKVISGPGDAILATSDDAELKQPTLTESKTNHDKKITVAFDEFVVNTTPLRRDYEKVIPEPFAVLHLHYRAEPILRNRGHPIPLEVRRPVMAPRRQSERTGDEDDEDDGDDDGDITGYRATSSLFRHRGFAPPQRDVKPLLLTINDDDEITAIRAPPEVIVLDSDSEDEGDGGNGGECEQEKAMLAIVKNEPFGVVKREREEISEDSQWKRIKREPEGAVEVIEAEQQVFSVDENQEELAGVEVGELVWDEGLEALWRATSASQGWQ